MSPQTLFILVMAAAALNGLLHLMTQSGLILLLGGIPAALYERVRGHTAPTRASMVLWLAGVITIAIVMAPTLAMRPGG